MKQILFILSCVPVASCVVDGSLGSDAPGVLKVDAGSVRAAPVGDAAPSASLPNDEHEALPVGELVPTSDAGRLPSCEANANDTACFACQKHLCCTVFAACTEHVPCACVSECLAPEASVADCRTHCAVSGFAELDALTECAVAECSEECQ